MNSKIKKLYFVALVPPQSVLQMVQNLKEEVAERFESSAALRSPPHITLHMPFMYREDKEEEVTKILQNFSSGQQKFVVKQEGFGAFPPRVVYVNVEKTETLEAFRDELIKVMRRSLKLENADYKNRPFHPHMTIAFRDLKKRLFPVAWEAFRDRMFSEEWECDHLVLLKHDGSKWNILERCYFTDK